MPIELKTPRLLLRRLEPHDAPVVFAYRSDPDVGRYQIWHPADVAEVEAFIESLKGVTPGDPGTGLHFAITRRETGRLIGNCVIQFPHDGPHEVELGITLAPAAQGQGYATEALQALLAYAFDELAKHRVYARVDPRNAPSRALMARVGLREEGHLRETAFVRGEWIDDVVYAMLDWEWQASCSEDR